MSLSNNAVSGLPLADGGDSVDAGKTKGATAEAADDRAKGPAADRRAALTISTSLHEGEPSMTLLLKDPEATLDYGVDWDSDYLRGQDALTASDWRVEPDEPGGIAVIEARFDAAGTSVTLGGGAAGKLYRLVNAVTTALGRADARSFTVRVEKR